MEGRRGGRKWGLSKSGSFWPWGIQTGPFSPCCGDFVTKFWQLFTHLPMIKPILGRRLNGFLGLSLNDRTILFLVILYPVHLDSQEVAKEEFQPNYLRWSCCPDYFLSASADFEDVPASAVSLDWRLLRAMRIGLCIQSLKCFWKIPTCVLGIKIY